VLVSFCWSAAAAQVASGGTYTLNRAVIANGGGESTDPVNNLYRVDGTAGQVAAGYGMTSTRFGLISGFWDLVNRPTAANASLSGRILSPDGLGIRNVSVILEGGSLTTPRTTLSSSFGYFSFDDLEAGQIYVISISSKRYGFANPTQTVSVFGNVTDLVFQANWQN
jgi:hypothetical protein